MCAELCPWSVSIFIRDIVGMKRQSFVVNITHRRSYSTLLARRFSLSLKSTKIPWNFEISSYFLFMSSLLEEFGHLIHIYSERNIKLTTTCTAKLSFPKEHACNVQKNESLAIQNSWIARGHGFRISFKINPNDVPVNNNDWSAIVEGLGIVLRDAKVVSHAEERGSLLVIDITLTFS